ncbi:NAD(P)/FAD-dependent oxidoreductase [Pyrococcus kukulkanii]|uniref:FAD-binding oxidoreductase n=1 Tax=Pyrococcus kukulkanii TaxID=1609559 RepID=A0ABV4T1H8_9EURY
MIGIIGGGIIGVATAYELAKLGEDVVVFEKKYLGSGSTFRCASGIRAQFTDEANIKLMKYSIERWKELSDELEHNVMFQQTGYLFLATSEKEVETFKNNIKLQNKFGVPTKLITPEEAKEIVPPLNTDAFLAGAWNPEDGKASPFHTLYAYKKAGERLGVKFYEYTKVISIEEGWKIKTTRGEFKVDIIVNATNAWAREINAMIGEDVVPIKPFKHQLVKTEPIERGQIEPLVCPPAWNDSYVIQDGEDGGVICGTALEYESSPDDVSPTYEFAKEVLRWAVKIVPPLRHVHIVRQWAGHYARTPDNNPAIGELVENFYVAIGFSGHGFMMAPAVAQALAEKIVKGRTKVPLDWEWFDPWRFERGELRSSAFQIG